MQRAPQQISSDVLDLLGSLSTDAEAQSKDFASGLPALDAAIGAAGTGEVWVVAGDPDATRDVTLHLARHWAHRAGALIVWPTALADAWMRRLLSSMANVPTTQLGTAPLHAERWRAVVAAADSMQRLDLRSLQRESISPNELVAWATDESDGPRCGAIIVCDDRLLWSAPGSATARSAPGTDTRDALSELEHLAREELLCVLVVVHDNKPETLQTLVDHDAVAVALHAKSGGDALLQLSAHVCRDMPTVVQFEHDHATGRIARALPTTTTD